MKYFIDFEATQFTNEIISIGCVREDGNSFYALVKPKKQKAITPFITDLTGITKDMLENEKSSDEVFENFFDWFFEIGFSEIVFDDSGKIEAFWHSKRNGFENASDPWKRNFPINKNWTKKAKNKKN